MKIEGYRAIRYKPEELDPDTQAVVHDYNTYMRVLATIEYAPDRAVPLKIN